MPKASTWARVAQGGQRLDTPIWHRTRLGARHEGVNLTLFIGVQRQRALAELEHGQIHAAVLVGVERGHRQHRRHRCRYGNRIQRAQRTAVGVRKNRLTTKLLADLLEPAGDFVERIVPRDPLQALGWGRPHSLGRSPAHGIKHAIWRIHPVQIFRDFRAQETAGHGM